MNPDFENLQTSFLQSDPVPGSPAPSDHPSDTCAPDKGATPVAVSANPQFLQALSALQRLPGEPRQPHDFFLLFARSYPQTDISKFARQHGLHRNTVTGWKTRFRWDERLGAYSDLCMSHTVQSQFENAQAGAGDGPARTEIEMDLRARALDLARSAMQAWHDNNDQPPTIQGVVRALELALKLNPPPTPVPDKNALANDPGYLDFLDRINKVYGPDAKAAHAARVEAASKRPDVQQGA